MRVRGALIVAATATSLVAAGALAPGAGASTTGVLEVDGVVYETTGLETVRAGAYVPAPSTPRPDPVTCVEDRQDRFVAVLATPQGVADPNPQRLEEVREAVRRASTKVASTSEVRSSGATVTRLRVACTLGVIDVIPVRLPDREDELTPGLVIQEMHRQRLRSRSEKYLVVVDGCVPTRWAGCGPAGLATIARDDRLVANNRNNRGPSYAVHWVGEPGGQVLWWLALHEMLHTMGAVQPSSPNAGEGFHCADGDDIMCPWWLVYDAQGPATVPATPRCPTTELDCGADDYFDPSSSGWLSTHWNVASPLNRWVDRSPR